MNSDKSTGSGASSGTGKGSPAAQPTRKPRRGSHILSTLLFLAAIGFAAAAVYLYLQDRDKPEERVPPTAQPGQNQLGAIIESLKAAGIDADYGRGTGKSNQLSQPGQMITIGDVTLLAFIYNEGDKDAAARERMADAEDIDAATMTLTTPSGRDLRETQPLHIAQGSNVITVLIGGDDKTAAEIERVIEALP